MERTYTIPQDRREEIEKLVSKYQKKAAKYNIPLTVQYGEPHAETIPVYKPDPITHVVYKVDTMKVEVFDLTINGEDIHKDGYTVAAKIEHLDGGNVVTPISGNAKPEWSHRDGYCEHCNSKRYRRVTFIVRHDDGSEKQVGRSCLKEYCGIDPHGIGYRNELVEILLDDDIRHYDFNARPVSSVYDTIKALAMAIRVNKKQGYIRSSEPGSNKSTIMEIIGKSSPTEAEMKEAEQMASVISEMNEDDAWQFSLNNVQNLLKSTYCKASHFGYIAYAPVAFEKYRKELERRAEREAERTAQAGTSAHIGKIGERMTFKIAEMKLVTSWESQWGWTWLYKFIDTDGNVLIWFASKPMERVNANGVYEDVTEVKSIKATVKDHTERDGVKQTVITRCKVA